MSFGKENTLNAKLTDRIRYTNIRHKTNVTDIPENKTNQTNKQTKVK